MIKPMTLSYTNLQTTSKVPIAAHLPFQATLDVFA
jgi:hypothetical protein